MDFVVAGFGVGAILMLLGFAVRDLGPLRYRSVRELQPVHDEWLAMCRSVGTVFVIGGLVVCLATLVSLLAGAGDRTGSRLVMAMVAMATIGCGIWTVLAIRRFVAMQPTASGLRFDSVDEGLSDPTERPNRRPRRGHHRQPIVPVEYHNDAVAVDSDHDHVGQIFNETSFVRDATAEPIGQEGASILQSWPDVTTLAPEREEQVEVPVELLEVRGDVPVEPTTVHPESSERVFSSFVLADVEAEVDEAGTPLPAQGFRSSLLANLQQDSESDQEQRGFTSSIFAGLEPRASESAVTEAGAAEVGQGEDASVDPPDQSGANGEVVTADLDDVAEEPRSPIAGSGE